MSNSFPLRHETSLKARPLVSTAESTTVHHFLRSGSRGSNYKSTMAVITLLLAIDGNFTKLNRVNIIVADVEQALQKLATNSRIDDCIAYKMQKSFGRQKSGRKL